MEELHKDKIEAARERKRKAREAAGVVETPVESVFAPEEGPAHSRRRDLGGDEPSAERLEAQGYFVTVAHASDPTKAPWYRPDRHSYSTLESARAAGVWSYPSTLHEKARCGVFRALWEQGKFLGGGLKFGCDFLVYPGQPTPL